MAVQIQGTVQHKSGGGGLGKLLGLLAGAGAGVATGGLALAPVAAGASLGGIGGELVGGMASKPGDKQLGIPVGGVAPSTAVEAKPSAMDRFASLLGTGTEVAGGIGKYNDYQDQKKYMDAMTRYLQGARVS